MIERAIIDAQCDEAKGRNQEIVRLDGFREVDGALLGDGIQLLDLARKAHRTFVL
ncbi:hypothetical protein [Sphingobium sp.]|uniref:hypothetical protein n=1 Tax=Sphingobium sp. TaxID=1912891 RepID=UPI002CC084AF|nr:hypothetical protein [Sphingobium sp.]HUD95389.1 hypothetical protein [Sphingobium sp.]